jgi:two-component system sensor histidine kinase KdpD
MSDMSPQPGVRPGPQVARRIGDATKAGLLRVTGTIDAVRTVPVGSGLAYSATLADDTGSLDLLFMGRATIRGIEPGVCCAVEGRAAERDGRLVVWNPRYRLLAPDKLRHADPAASGSGTAEVVEAAGRFRVYLGAAAGVGKTCAMLDEAQRRRRRGTDVVIGFVESHGRLVTTEAMESLEVVPRKTVEYRGARFEELDLDAVLARRPEVVLVDELAHTNIPGSGRNEKRWQDVIDLLDAGIGVITTVNIQHLESLTGAAEQITGSPVREWVPDALLLRADQIELVDSSPEQLRRRMLHGNIYPPDQIPQALNGFFRTANLSALRELTLRFLADRAAQNRDGNGSDDGRGGKPDPEERILVVITGAPDSAAVLRRARQLGTRLTVVLASADGTGAATPGDHTAALRSLTSELGGEWIDLPGGDFAESVLRFVRDHHITQIVLGPSRRSRWPGFGRRARVADKIFDKAPSAGVDLHVLAGPQNVPAPPGRWGASTSASSPSAPGAAGMARVGDAANREQ